MSPLRNVLMSCGGTLVVINAVLFVALHDSLKAHGFAQITLILIGLIMFLLGTFVPRNHKSYREKIND